VSVGGKNYRVFEAMHPPPPSRVHALSLILSLSPLSLSPLQVDPVFALQSAFKHIFYLPPSLHLDFRAKEKSYLILTAIHNLKALSY